MLGYGNDDASKGWSSIHPDDREQLSEVVNSALASCGSFTALTRRIRPDNGALIWVESKGRVVCTEEGKPAAVRGIMIDQTIRVDAEQRLTQENRRKDEFLAMLAHELRNPLAPISAAAQLIKLSAASNDHATQAGDVIIRQVQHMTELVDDLLDVSRVTRGLVELDREFVDLNAVLVAAVEQAKPLIASRLHTLTTTAAGSAAWVLGDRTRLVQVVSNLLNNAAKYTQQQGRITVAVCVEGNQARISVADNGSGIESELLPHIFDLFSQAARTPDRSQGGLGLGLALVKSIVTLHGGTVAANSPGRGQGTTVQVILPTTAPAPVPLGPVEIEAPWSAQRSLRIAIVDDNEDAAELLATLMEQSGHRPTVFFSAEAFLASLEHEVDVFILDIGLPRINGHQLARQLRAHCKHAAATLVALTGYGQAHDAALSKAAGFDHHLVKPVELTRLQDILRRVA